MPTWVNNLQEDISQDYAGSVITSTGGLADHDILIYPNPSPNGSFLIDLSKTNGAVTLNLYALTGRQISSQTIARNKDLIQISIGSQGIYLLKIVSDSYSKIFKLVVP